MGQYMREPLYFDHNASTPVPGRVRDVVNQALSEGFGNPSAGHAFGRRARAYIDKARAQVAQLLDCDADEIVFSGGGTESNNLAIRGVFGGHGPKGLVISAVEHPATVEPAKWLSHRGTKVQTVDVNERGQVSAEAVGQALLAVEDSVGREGLLVSVMLAQNETGVLQPVAEIAAKASAMGALVHTDAAQAVGKIKVRVRELGVDLLSIAGHKLYAPKGVGALYIKRGVRISPVLLGAGHEHGIRPGTENVAAIAGLGEACAMAHADVEAEAARQSKLIARLEDRLSAAGYTVHGAGAPRLPNTSNGRFGKGVRGSELLARCEDVAFSTGSACHAGHERPSAVLLSMGIEPGDALGAIRLSIGRMTTEAMIDEAAQMLIGAAVSVGGG